MRPTELHCILTIEGRGRGRGRGDGAARMRAGRLRGGRSACPARPGAHGQHGVVLFVCLILLLVLTVLGVSLARQQTLEERLAQNEFDHQFALQVAQAALQAGYDDVGGPLAIADYTSGTTPGLATLGQELTVAPYTVLDRTADWANPGVDTIPYTNNGAPLPGVPAASSPQFVVEDMPQALPKGCSAGTPGGYGGSGSNVHVRRITAHASGVDGAASATVQLIRYEGC
jgi:Tfp pilus assembly protein PilX